MADPLTSVKAVCDAIQTGIAGISGINAAPANPTEQMPDWPYATTYPSGIDEAKIGPDPLYTVWWDITVEVHWLRQRLPVDVAAALTTFPEAILGKIVYVLQSNHTAFKDVKASFGNMEWGDKLTIGFQFKVSRVKIQTAVPTS